MVWSSGGLPSRGVEAIEATPLLHQKQLKIGEGAGKIENRRVIAGPVARGCGFKPARHRKVFLFPFA